MKLRAPFPYFGSKADVAEVVWARLGDPPNYVEPFAGSLAVLLQRPAPGKVETVNDYSGLVTNFWRAVQAQPDEVARYADNPVHELDLHAWHALLTDAADGLRDSLAADPRFYDVELAGRWAWGASAWLGGGWCDGALLKRRPVVAGRSGTPYAGQGVHSTLVRWQLPHLSGGAETGVGYGRGVHQRAGRHSDGLVAWMRALAERLRFVRVCCGDFARVLTPAVTTSHGVTGVFLDPPYTRQLRARRIYEREDDSAAPRARAWAIENGQNPLLRIALCGYEGEHDMPVGWTCLAWRTRGGYGNQSRDGRGRQNSTLERIWFSPHCTAGNAFGPLFDDSYDAPFISASEDAR